MTYDADGNLLSDGQRDFSWDAENRLVKITYPSQSGKETDFTYDGLSRRTAITSTPVGGGSGVTTSYLWCGTRICQARDATNAVTREYYTEGELVPGSPAQPYYYGPDQIGTVRRAFASTSSAPAYSYDPYGNPLQTTAPVTDFVYAGMFYNADSGLYLTQYRAYDPAVGRWLSRDPLGEGSDPAANLYRYARDNPISFEDPNGKQWLQAVVGLATVAVITFEYYEYYSHPPPLPRNPLRTPPQPTPSMCTIQNPTGVSGPFLQNGKPSPLQTPAPVIPEPPELESFPTAD